MLLRIATIIVLCLAAGEVHGKEAEIAPAPPPAAASSRIILSGKSACPLKHSVVMPFVGELTGLQVKVGQPVEAGEVLARYRLSPEAILNIRRRLAPPRLQELAVKLAEVEAGLAEVQGELRGLKPVDPGATGFGRASETGREPAPISAQTAGRPSGRSEK